MRHHRSGNIFAILFGGVALVGLLGVGTMSLVVGPATTVSKVTQQNLAQNDLMMNAKVVVMNASTRDNMGDEDNDGYVEPVPFVPVGMSNCTITLPASGQGGCLPTDIGAIQTDPWGTQYAYCVWDHGTTNTSTNRIQGEDSTSGAVLAIISAGPNKRFDTPCLPYDGDPATNDDAINANGISDDLVQIYTYAAAVAGSGGLWELKQNEPTTAVIDKKLEIGDITSGTGFAFDTATGQGEFPYIKTDYIASRSGGTTPVTMASNIALDDNWLSGDGGNEGVTVSANGNVFLGRTDLTASTTISGMAVVVHSGGRIRLVSSGDAASGTNYIQSGDPDGNTGSWRRLAIGNYLHSIGASVPKMVIDENSNVGIGISSPTHKLHVDGFIRTKGIVAVGTGSSDPTLEELYTATSVDGFALGQVYGGGSNGSPLSNNEIVLLNADDNNDIPDDGISIINYGLAGPTTAMRILGNGNIGIKNSTPSQLLHIDDKSTGGGDQTVVQVGNGSGSLFLTHNAPHISSNSRYDDGQWRYEADGAATTIKFGSGSGNGVIEFSNAPIGNANDPLSFIERMRIAEDGNVGIGTTTPQSELDLRGAITIGGNSVDHTAGMTSYIEFNTDHPFTSAKGDGFRIYRDSTGDITGNSANDWYIFEKTDGNGSVPDGAIAFANRGTANVRSIAMVISGHGHVGIGNVVSPSHLLQVNGVARSTQASFATSSDRRVKTGIHDIEDGLGVINRLRPVTYEYTKEYQGDNPDLGGIRRGFIAQEVEEILPDAVTRTEEKVGDHVVQDFRVLKNDDFVPLLVRAVQELKAENDALRAEIEEVRSMIKP